MTADWTSSSPERAMPVSAMALAMPSEAPPSDDERIRDAVSREINTWLRDVLPVIVRAEVERQLDARLDGDAVDGGDHE